MKCFLSFSYKTDVSLIKEILSENKVKIVDSYTLSPIQSVDKNLKKNIAKADFAIFDLSADSSNVYYELGIAEGLEKDILLISDETEKIPFDLFGKLYISTKDRKLLKITIEKFIKRLHKKDFSQFKPSQNRQIAHNKNELLINNSITNAEKHPELREILQNVKSLRDQGTESQLMEVFENLLTTLKVQYVSSNSLKIEKDIGVDFALWDKKLEKTIGNPIIIELKRGDFTSTNMDSIWKKISSYAHKSEAKLTLLIYLDNSGNRIKFEPSLNPLIMAFDFEDFVKELTFNSFEKVIVSHRNKIAHEIT